MPVYQKGMYLKKNDEEENGGKSFQIVEINKKDKKYTLGYKKDGIWKENKIYENTIISYFRPAGTKIVITRTELSTKYEEVGKTPYKVGQKIQNEQGYIYTIVSAYDKIRFLAHKDLTTETETRYLRFKINDGLFNKEMTPEQLIEGRYLFSVLPSEMVIGELYKYDDNDNMDLRERKTIKELEKVETEENKKILDKYNEKLEELKTNLESLEQNRPPLETREQINNFHHRRSDLVYKINRLKIKDEVYYLKFLKNSNSEYTEEIVDNSKKFYQYPSNSYLADPNYHVDDNFVGLEGGNKTRRKKNKKQKPRKTKNNKSKKRKIARQ